MGLSLYFITGPARRRRPTRRISSRSRLLLLRTPSSFEWVIDFPFAPLTSNCCARVSGQCNGTLAWMSMKFDRRICNNCSIVIQLEAEVTADGRIWDEVVRKPEVLNPEATTSFRLSRFHWMAINRQRIRRGLSLSLNVWLLIYSRGVLWGAGMWTSGESSILFMILLHWETAALIFPIYCPNDWDTLSKVTISS